VVALSSLRRIPLLRNEQMRQIPVVIELNERTVALQIWAGVYLSTGEVGRMPVMAELVLGMPTRNGAAADGSGDADQETGWTGTGCVGGASYPWASH